VGAGFSLAGTPHKSLAFDTMRRTLSLLPKLRSLVGKTVFKSLGLSDLASLHVAAPSRVKAGAQPAFSSPIEANGPGGDTDTLQRNEPPLLVNFAHFINNSRWATVAGERRQFSPVQTY
jgi:hypothetical protein